MQEDESQRFEVTYLARDGVRRVFGHAATPEGVAALKASVRLNPGMGSPEVRVVVPASEFSPMGFPEPASGGSEPKKRAYDIVDRD